MTTESSVTDTVLPPFIEPQDNDPFAEEVDAHYAKGSSAGVAAKRMGLFGQRETTDKNNQPSRLAWFFNLLKVILFLVPLALSAMLFLIVQQQSVLLESLDAAFRHGQLQQLPAEIKELQTRVDAIRSEFVSVQAFDSLRQSQGDLARTLNEKLYQYIRNDEEQSAVPKRLALLEQRIEGLQGITDAHDKRISSLASEWQIKWETLASQKAATTQGSRSVKKSQRVIKPVSAPFTLTSIEHRGGQQYAVIIPHVSVGNRWADIRMLTPGESINGWTLASIDGNQARFLVNGKPQTLTLQ